MLQERVQTSTLCLVIIGATDLVVSLMWLNAGNGEGNPIFARLAHMGAMPFAVGKLVLLAGPILLLEYARKHNARSAELGTWIAVVAYVGLLAAHTRHLVGI